MERSTEILTHVRKAATHLVAALDQCADRLPSADLETAYREVATAMDACLCDLNRLELWGTANRLPSSELWNVVGHYLHRGWLQNRARTKPRGYAGDHELLGRMYENRQCEDPLGALMDRYFLEEAAPRAVRHRMQMMADWMVAAANSHSGAEGIGELQFAVVGSAFGLEVRHALLRLDAGRRRRVRVVLLDLDPVAIEFAREQLAPLLGADQLTAVATNLFRLPERPQVAATLSNSDQIFCPGLFDYLEDAAAQAMLRCLHGQLAPSGVLTVFQFAPHNSTRAFMEWIGNWYLLYRDAQQFQQLIASAGFAADAVHFGAEPLGVDLFASIRRE